MKTHSFTVSSFGNLLVSVGLVSEFVGFSLFNESRTCSDTGLINTHFCKGVISSFQLMQMTFGFFTVLFDRVGWESGSTGEEWTKALLHLVAQQLSFRVDSTKICTLLSQLKSCLTSRVRPFVDSDGLLQYKGSFNLCKEVCRSLHARSPAEMGKLRRTF